MKWILGSLVLLALVSLTTWTFVAHNRVGPGPYRIGWEDDAPDQVMGADGEPTSLAIDIVREAARRRGIKLQWSMHDESAEAALRSGAVELWPVFTVTPERLKTLHISAPYLESVVSLIVLADSHYRRVEDLAGKTVAYRSQPINLKLASRYLPNSHLVAKKSTIDLLDGLTSHTIDAAFLEQDEVIHTLLRGGPAPHQAFSIVPIPDSRVYLGVGSTKNRSAVADALRNEIDSMANEGRLAAIFTDWGYLSGRGIAAVDALVASRRRENSTRIAAVLFAVLFLLALWQTVRYWRESTRARSAETALLKSAAESRQMEERLRLLAHALQSARDCISISDNSSHILYVNDAFSRTYEYPLDELIGRPTAILRSTNPDRALSPEVAAAITTLGWQGEIWSRSKSGREFPVALSTSQVRDDNGNLVAMVGVANDISARKQAEEEHTALVGQYLQSQKMETVGRLAGGIAHDFNNLLTVINGYSDLSLQKLAPTDPLRAFSQQIRNAGERAAGLTRQLLAFSRKQLFQPTILDVNATIREAAPMLQRLIGEQITLRLNLDAALGQLLADGDQIHQVIMNLVVNARDAMPKGGTLRMETRNVTAEPGSGVIHNPDAKPGPQIRITVADTGIGMDQATRQRIFEPFFTTKPGQGTGLGLATVYGIVRQSGGWIDVESEVGVGTSFHIYLPRADSESPAECAPNPVPLGTGNETILLVEDQDAVRSFASAALTNYGYRVLEAVGGEEALDVLRKYPGEIHLLLTDVVLSGMNGRELAERFREMRPDIKVMFTSGYTADVIEVRSLMDDRVPFLRKPFTPKELAVKVREVLQSAI